MHAQEAYDGGRKAHGLALAALERRASALGTWRLVVALSAVALTGGIVWARFDASARMAAWAVLGGMIVVFVALVVVHARVHDAASLVAAVIRFHERGLARLSHSWDALPSAVIPVAADHPYARDIDVFGRASLMSIVDATETRFGQEHLARLLSQEAPVGWPEEVLARQEAARDLASRFGFRERFAALAGLLPEDDRRDARAVLAWAEGSGDEVPTATRWLAWLLPAFAAGLAALGPTFGLSAGAVTVLVAVEIALGNVVGARMAPMLDSVSARSSWVTQWRALIAAIESESFDAPLLVGLRSRFSASGQSASREIASLERILGFADARYNEGFRYIFGAALLWNAHCAFALLRWRSRAGKHLRGWLDALGEVEALASLATLTFEHPDFVWPALTPEPVFEAQALGHPLIEEKRRVGNDVSLSRPGCVMVVTGSNMSGKSTLLRAIGANAVLALAGAPVCARSLRIGPLQVATSMRIEDSLEGGISHFYAELRTLKRIIDLSKSLRPLVQERGSRAAVLFLLDEILHGTNSRERIAGARAVVRELLAHGALGVVSTHDLGITALEQEIKRHVENAHFEEQVVGESMTFDYVLRPGIVQSSNALRLMRVVGIDVPDLARADVGASRGAGALEARIRLAVPADLGVVTQLCAALWADEPVADLEAHAASVLSGKPASTMPLSILVAEVQADVVGFIEVGLRSHADGCDERYPVGFIEGWFVQPKFQRRAIGRALMDAAEGWARAQGARELASDTWLDHETSQRAHQALGFEIVDRCVHFRKSLTPCAEAEDGMKLASRGRL
jgi:GNAT superfamily N-acetyltransferase/ABC-type multidrug transport system fused ATPase/permease subunit